MHKTIRYLSIAAIAIGVLTTLLSGTSVTGAAIGAPNTGALWTGLGAMAAGIVGIAVSASKLQ